MKMRKRILSLLLSTILLTLPAIPVHAAQEKGEVYTISQTYVNPIYEYFAKDKQQSGVDEKSTYVLEREVVSDSMSSQTLSAAKSAYLTSDEKIADLIRKSMVNRDAEMNLYYSGII